MAIVGVPGTRVSEQLVQQSLLRQVQTNLGQLYQLETQLSTGKQFQLPSENPVAATRVMGLQRLIAQNVQYKTNLATSQSYMTATDAAMSDVSSLVNNARGDATSVIGTTATDTQRAAVAQQLQQAVQQLLDNGNQQFNGRYLFAGSDTTSVPFTSSSTGLVAYTGNDVDLQSYGATNLLINTNVQANQVFGTVSDAVRGSASLDPDLTWNTAIGDLRQGQGIHLGRISISDGTKSRLIDFSQASTIGDIARLIHANSPDTNNPINVEITPRSLVLTVATGNLKIQDVGGTMAADLGIQTEGGSKTVTSADLGPNVQMETSLDDILGSRSQTVLRSASGNADIDFKADHNGIDADGVTVSLVDNGTAKAGSEHVVYDAALKTLTIYMEDNRSSAQQIVDAVNTANYHGVSPFTAALDPIDSSRGGQTPLRSGVFSRPTEGGSGEDFDRSHGLQIVNGGPAATIDVSKAKTIGDLLNTLNNPELGLLAQINAAGTGIDVRTRVSGADFEIGENGGKTATQLGIRSMNAATQLNTLNFGRGVTDFDAAGESAKAVIGSPVANNGLVIAARSGGPQWNGYVVNFVAAATRDKENVTYDATNHVINIAVTAGVTTANDVIRLFNKNSDLCKDFGIALDTPGGAANTGNGTLAIEPSATTKDGASSGSDFRITRSDGVSFEIDLHAAKTIGDVLKLINENSVNTDPSNNIAPDHVPLVAQLNAAGNGIELVDNSIGTGKLAVTPTNGSLAASDLGLIRSGQDSYTSTTTRVSYRQLSGAAAPALGMKTLSMATRLADLNFGASVMDYQGPGWTANASVGSTAANSGLIVMANSNGNDWNGATISVCRYVDPTIPAQVSYSQTTHDIAIMTAANGTSANDVISLFQNNTPLATDFSVYLNPNNVGTPPGDGLVALQGPVTTSGGASDDSDFRITRNDGVSFEIDMHGATTIGDILNRINNNAVNIDPANNASPDHVPLVARLSADGKQIELVDGSVGTHNLTVTNVNGSSAANDLGLIPVGQQSTTVSTVTTTPDVLTGSDVNPQETSGLFTALLRLTHGISTGDNVEAGRALSMLETQATSTTFVRAELGSRQQAIDVLGSRLADQQTDLEANLSASYDSDLAEVVSQLSTAQVSLEAAFRAIGQMSHMTLLDYL